MSRRPDEVELPAIGEAYLADLDFALRNSEDQEEVLRSVREHLAEAISGVAPAERRAATKAVIDELGTVDQVAFAASSATREEPERRTGNWEKVLLGLAVLSVPTAIFPLVGIPFALAVLAASVAVIVTRRGSRLAAIAAACAGVALALGIVIAGLSFPFGSGVPTPQEVQVVPLVPTEVP